MVSHAMARHAVTAHEVTNDAFGQSSCAEFSTDRRYRYSLWRRWSAESRYLLFIGLNPSTADEHDDDRSINRCRQFTARWGYGTFTMAKLFGLGTKDPSIMLADPAPIGRDNNRHLKQLARKSSAIVCANPGRYQGRDIEVINLLDDYPHQCLDINQTGTPKYPLYVEGDTPLKPWPLPVIGQAGAKFWNKSGAIYGGGPPKQAFNVNLLQPVPVYLMTSRVQARLLK